MSRGGSLSQPPQEFARMDGLEDEDMVLPRVSKLFHSVTYGTKGCSLVFYEWKLHFHGGKACSFVCFMDENVCFMDENCTLWARTVLLWMRLSVFWKKNADLLMKIADL